MADSNTEFPTTIGADAVFKGQLTFEKGVRLLGKFEGEINSQGQLVVAEGAALNGDVTAGSIQIDGQVKGNLNAKSKIQLTASARLEGDVESARLEVAEGAVLIGRCVVGVNGTAKTSPSVKNASAPVQSVASTRSKGAEPVEAGRK